MMLLGAQGERTGKIVGMLLGGMEVAELLNLLESPDDLATSVGQANLTIEKMMQDQQQQQQQQGAVDGQGAAAAAGPQ